MTPMVVIICQFGLVCCYYFVVVGGIMVYFFYIVVAFCDFCIIFAPTNALSIGPIAQLVRAADS